MNFKEIKVLNLVINGIPSIQRIKNIKMYNLKF